MGLWAYGIRCGDILRITEREIWQSNKERKITSQTPFQSLSNCNYYKDYLTIKESTLIRSTNFWEMQQYKLWKATQGKQVNLGLAIQKTLIWTNWRKEWELMARLIYGKLWQEIQVYRGQVLQSKILASFALMRKFKSFIISTLIVCKCMWLKLLKNNRVP